MTEKDVIRKAEQIVETLAQISMGKGPGMLSNEIFRKLSAHTNFFEIRDLYVEYLQIFDGAVNSPEKIKRLSDLRLAIVQLYEE